MYQRTCIMCDSECVVNGCNGWAEHWCRNKWCKAAGQSGPCRPVEKNMDLLESYGSHVTVFHVPSHAGPTENERDDELANQGRLSSPLWTANKLWLGTHNERDREDLGLDLHIVGIRDRTPPLHSDEFVPWTPQLVISRGSSGVIVCTPDFLRPSERVFIHLDTPSPRHSEDLTDFEVQWTANTVGVYLRSTRHI